VLIVPVCWLANTPISWISIGLVVPVFLVLLVFISGCIAWLSSLNAHYRDVGYALPFAMQIGMFVSPVVYDLDRVRKVLPPHWHWLYDSNPVACAIGLMRWSIVGSPMPTLLGIVIAVIISVAVFLSGLSWFQRADQQLADRI
jgi:lipopolysaccharide transport system permease protein